MAKIDTGYTPTDKDKAFSKAALDRGCPYQAKYILMFGVDALEQSRLIEGIIPKHEAVYKKWVEEGHPWDWYFDLPEDTIL